MPFPMAQQVNLPACSPHCFFNAERQAEKLNNNVKVIGLTQLGIKTQSTALKADALTTWPSELLIGTCYNFTINVVQWLLRKASDKRNLWTACRFESMREFGFISHSSETLSEHEVNAW